MAGRGPLNDKLKIDSLEKLDLKATGAAAIEEVLADISKDKLRAARKTLALLATQPGMPEGLMTGARRLVFAKGADSHDYKFSSAALEDYYHATPAWRNRFLATSVFWLRGSGDRDNDLIKQARAALA
jgi:hypothetical protein